MDVFRGDELEWLSDRMRLHGILNMLCESKLVFFISLLPSVTPLHYIVNQ